MKAPISNIIEHTNRIIAYGCSYTAGAELMDHVYLNMTFNECNSIKQHFSSNPATVFNFSNKFKTKGADSLNRQNSWAAHLSKKLNRSFENRAEESSGLDQVYFKICKDLQNGLIKGDDLVVVGLVDIGRIIVFNHDGIRSSLLGWQLRDDNPHDITLIELLNDDWLFFNYYKTLKLMLLLNDKINIRFQQMTARQNLKKYDSLIYVQDYAEEVWQELQPFILSNDVLELKEGQQLCGFYHHPVESHIDLADKIYSKLTDI